MGGFWSQGVVDNLRHVLAWLTGATGSPGLALVLFAILFRAVLLPVTSWQRHWASRQASIQPMLNVLQQKYRNDRESLSREQARLYQSAGISPWSGCLTALGVYAISIATWAALYQLLRSDLVWQSRFLWIPQLSYPDHFALNHPIAYFVLPVLVLLIPAPGQQTVRGAMWGRVFLAGLAVTLPAGLTLFYVVSMALEWVVSLPTFTVRAAAVAAGLAVAVTGFLLARSPYLPILAGLLVYQLIYPRLAAALRGAGRGKTFLVFVAPRLLLAGVLAAAAALLRGQPASAPARTVLLTLGPLPPIETADVLVWALYVALLLAGLALAAVWRHAAPELALPAFIDVERYLRRDKVARRYELELAQMREARLEDQLSAVDAIASRQPSQALGQYRAVLAAADEVGLPANHPLRARAFLHRARLHQQQGHLDDAIADYRRAYHAGNQEAVLAIAPLAASRGSEDDTSLDDYIRYLERRRGAARSNEDRSVLAVLERACRVDETTPPDAAQRKLQRLTKVETVANDMPWAPFYTGMAHLRLRETVKAREAFERATRAEPTNAAAYYQLSQIYSQEGNLDRARDALGESLRHNPRQPAAAGQYGVLLVQPLVSRVADPAALSASDRSQLERAVGWLRQAAAAQPNDQTAYWLGRALLLLGAYAEAADALDQAVHGGVRNRDYFYYLGRAQIALGRQEQAAHSWREAIKIDSDFSPAHHALGDLLLARKDPKGAETHYRETLRLAPTNIDASRGLGCSLHQTGKYTEAVAVLTPVAAGARAASLALAASLAQLAAFSDALAVLQAAHRQYEPDVESVYLLGCIHANLYQAAIHQQKAAAAQPGAETALADAADKACLHLTAAEDAFQRCLTLSLNHWRSQMQLGHLALLDGNLSEARRRYQLAQAGGGDHPQLLIGLAHVALAQGDTHAATRAFEAAAHLEPASQAAHLGLARLAQQRGDIETALGEYAKAGDDARVGVLHVRRGDYRRGADHLNAAHKAGDQSDATLYHLGFALAQLGEQDAALAIWSTLQERHGDDAELAHNIGLLSYTAGAAFVQAGRFSEAAHAWQRYYGAEPDETGRRILALTYVHAARVAPSEHESMELVERAAEWVNGDATLQYHLGVAALRQHAYRRAEALLGEIEGDLANQPAVSYHRAVALIGMGRGQETRARLLRLQRSGPAHLRSRASWALVAVEVASNCWEDAAWRITDAPEGDPLPAPVAELMVTCLLAANRFDEAERLLQSDGLGLAPAVRVAIGTALVNNGKPADALPHFRALVKASQDPVRDQALLVDALRAAAGERVRTGDYAQAVDWLNEAFRLAPDHPTLRREYTAVQEAAPNMQLLAGHFDKAATMWADAQHAMPQKYVTAHRLAILYHRWALQAERAGDFTTADRAWRMAAGEWALLATADAYWEEWRKQRGQVYGTELDDATLGQIRRTTLRDKIDELHRAFEEAYTAAGDRRNADRHQEYRKLLQQEMRLAEALKAAAGIAATRGVVMRTPVYAGPMMLQHLDLKMQALDVVITARRVPGHDRAIDDLASVLNR